MQIGSRFTIGVHIITAIDYFRTMDRVNSEFLAGSIGVNPVIVRTVISQLRKAGIVQTQRGSSGAELAKRLDEITLYDIYKAVGSVDTEEGLFHFHEQPNPDCPVGRNIHKVLDQRLLDAQESMEEKLRATTLADIAEDMKRAVSSETNQKLEKLKTLLQSADAILIGAGAGLSTAAGLTYSGERFHRLFADFEKKYGITDMYTGGFYPFPDEETKWAWWSRQILCNRYQGAPKPVYQQLLSLVKDKDYFVLTTNVDHQFQRAGFDKQRLFYTQGDYGLLQCTKPCCRKTWDNEEQIRLMAEQQKDMKIPTALIPKCPNCGRPMTTNLRVDERFVEDDGWQAASRRYADFVASHESGPIVYLELGVGLNTPTIIKVPFLRMTMANPRATYVCLSLDDIYIPDEIADRSIGIVGDIAGVLDFLTSREANAFSGLSLRNAL